MLSTPVKDPKVVLIKVCRAEGLKFKLPENKKKKTTNKWRVVFIGGSKKRASECVEAPNGDPRWDCEVELKLASRHEPIAILIMDSEEHHVGQVVIPTTSIPSLPADDNPWLPYRCTAAELEATKKTSDPCGTLYYWIYVCEYHSDLQASKSGGLKKNTGLSGSLSVLSKSRQEFKSLFNLSNKGDKSEEKSVKSGSSSRKKNSILSRRSKRESISSMADSARGNLSRSMYDLSGCQDLSARDINIDDNFDGEVPSEAGSSLYDGSIGLGSDYGNTPQHQVKEPWQQGELMSGVNGSVGRTKGRYHKRQSSGYNINHNMKTDEIKGHYDNMLDVQGSAERNKAHRSSSFESSGSKVSKADSGLGTYGKKSMCGAGLPDYADSGFAASDLNNFDLLVNSQNSHKPNLRRPPSNASNGSRKKMNSNSTTKKDLIEELYYLRQENDELHKRLMEANRQISNLRDQNTTYQSMLSSRELEVDRLSRSLCDLRNTLLQDGFVEYLECR